MLYGINLYHPDAAVATLCDGAIQMALERERLTRVKHAAGFPKEGLQALGARTVGKSLSIRFAIPRQKRARLKRRLIFAARAPRLALSRARVWRQIDDAANMLSGALRSGSDRLVAREYWIEHHRAHLASTFFVSPFEEAAVLSVDGLGDFASAMWGIGRDNKIEVLGEVTFPHSLGFFYTALTQFLGFTEYGDEYKAMGLAAYGEPEFTDLFEDIVRPHRNNGFRLGLSYFRHHREGIDMTWAEGPPRLARLWSDKLARRLGPPRRPGQAIESRHRNIAASLQQRHEEVFFHMLRRLHDQTGLDNLCLAGGVALNCVANGKIFSETPFQRVYIPPAPGDAGLAIGAPLWVWHQEMGHPRNFIMDRADWGPRFSESEARAALEARGVRYRKVGSQEEICRAAARMIADGKVVGWFQGRMEFGPRALGNRSILADPRKPEMKDILNHRIKQREPFRPFAPSVLAERQHEYFENTHPSPFMSFAFPVRREKRSTIPAVTHVDGTARLQTVSRDTNPLFHRLLHAFESITGVPVLLNTSFNENEPIVCTPEHAVDCFIRTEMDVLVIGKLVAERST